MYWRSGAGFASLWVASLTLAMSALASLVLARSSGAALAFLATAIVFTPPFQEWLGSVRHNFAPAKTAFFGVILLVPVGLGFLVVDGVAMLDREAKRLGFASAGQLARARDLKLATPQALAAHDEKIKRAAVEHLCSARRERPPLDCLEPAHGKAALAYVMVLHSPGELGRIIRNAINQQRKDWLSRDRECAALLDRIDDVALPTMLESPALVLDLAAAMWARHLPKQELDQLTEQALPGASQVRQSGNDVLGTKLKQLAPGIEKELDQALQAWAVHIVTNEPSWKAFLNGRTPLNLCGPALEAVRR